MRPDELGIKCTKNSLTLTNDLLNNKNNNKEEAKLFEFYELAAAVQ